MKNYFLFSFMCIWFLPATSFAQNVVSSKEAPVYEIAKGKGKAQLFLNATNGSKDAALSFLTLAPGAAVPEHQHVNSGEYLYIRSGRVEMMIAGKKLVANEGDAVYIPKATLHSAKVLGQSELAAVQIYVGSGPEQRFTKGKRLN